ncbi:MAG: NAD(P)H-dependent glycerol-3-phosphate dehydrogenase [Candidatus Marinimicrobia bacterium]|nr:NAD(P)H-dependent glycerol-3-phosphate dehydrogenase [Candidatus Neomarinimicrobiota bacterium]MDP7059322.1 NAD(P)H-dependent glycerol-3-phosphate dehydrogenase [Candidatus Neomarinimicrobiota bacterium]
MIRKDHPKIITVLGAGSWGGTIAEHLAQQGHSVTVWHRNEEELNQMSEKRTHPFLDDLQFSQSIRFVESMNDLKQPELVVLGIPSHGVRDVMNSLPDLLQDSVYVNLAKGIENDSLKRMSEVVMECGGIDGKNVVTLSGPSHAEEVAKGLPTTLVAASSDSEIASMVQQVFSSNTLRVYINSDIIGVELGGSVKNVIALAAGVCDGIGFGDNTKAALITRGIVEITRLGMSIGGKAETFAGLSGIGDLIATCLSRHSRNRYVGEQIGRGRSLEEILDEMTMVAEGVKTASSVKALSEKHSVEMPICDAIYESLYEGLDPKKAVNRLMARKLGSEEY